MCYALPGPRCSTHARTKLNEAATAYEVAKADHERKKVDFNEASDDKAAAELMNSERILKEAQKVHETATRKLADAEQKRKKTLASYKEAREEYRATPEGIQGFRDVGKHKVADHYQAIRDARMDALKTQEAREQAVNPTAETYKIPDQEWGKRGDDTARTEASKTFNRKRLAKLANHADYEVRTQVARNHETPSTVLAQMHKRGSDLTSYESEALAGNPNTPIEIVNGFITKGEHLQEVAKNPSAPTSFINKMADSENRSIRQAVASNPSCPPERLKQFASEPGLVSQVAANPSTPKETLEGMSQSEQRFIATNKGASPEMLDGLADNHAQAVAGNPSASEQTLRRIASNPRSGWTLLAVAGNPSTPNDVVEELSKKYAKDRKLKKVVAERKKFAV